MKKYDHIEEVEKSIDEITVVEKFNPFHDAQGKFSSSNGFKTYSANPNTKAGAMAISRSAAAGHGNTPNVHRQSYGENIKQNADWMARGNQPNNRWHGSTTLRNRVEAVNGLAGASNMGATWQRINQARGRTTKPGKQTPQQQPKQPKKAPKQQPQQQTQPAQKPTSDRQVVQGKDISKSFKYNPNAKGGALDQVADAQGFKGKPQLQSDRAEFSKAVQASGIMCYRTITSGTDVVTGKHKTSKQFADDLKNADAFSHNGTGLKAYGYGLYIASTPNPVKGKGPSRADTTATKNHSAVAYGNSTSTTVAMTLDPSAKIGDYGALMHQYRQIPARTRNAKYGNNASDGFGAFAAAQGYDAVTAKGAGFSCDYTVVYNRTKLVIFDG